MKFIAKIVRWSIFMAVVPPCSAQVQTQAHALLDRNEGASDLLSMMNTWVMILGILVTLLLSGSLINFAIEFRRSRRIESRIREHEASISDQMRSFSEKYNLALLKTPEAILQDSLRQARSDYDPRIEAIGRSASIQLQDLNKRVERLEASLKTTEDRLIGILVEQRKTGSEV